MKSLIKSGRLDQFGMTASIACALHCALVPLAISSLPIIGLGFLANIWVEIGMIVLSLAIGTWALIGSYIRHRNIVPVLVLVLGFVLIANGHLLWHEMEALLVPLGGFTIAGAHYINWKLNRVCGHQHKE